MICSLQSEVCSLQMSYTVIIVITETKSRWLYSPIFTSPSATNCCVRGTRTQPLICVGCSVYYWVSCAINKGGFSVVVNTHLPRFEALAYVLPHFDALNHVMILVSSPFIFQRFAEVWYSVLNLQPRPQGFSLKEPWGRGCWIFVKRRSICVCWIVQSVHLSEVCC